MIINNLQKLEQYFDNIPQNHCIQIVVIQRKKDLPDLGKSENLIKDYYIKSRDHLLTKWDEIKTIAETFHARVYVNISPISFETITFRLLHKFTDLFESQQYGRMPHAFRSVVANEKGILKRFLIDFDSEDEQKFNEMIKDFSNLMDADLLETIVETKSGWHIICKPFNRILFKEQITNTYKEDYGISVDAFTNQSTLLYYNNEKRLTEF